MNRPVTLKPLHPDALLSLAKLAIFEKWSTEELIKSLAPGQDHCLKARSDGTMLDGHHRVYVPKSRKVDVEVLPRELIHADRNDSSQ